MTELLVLLAGFLGGVSNALAGGGTFLIFPALLLAGIAPVQANATASLIVLPGVFASAWVYRDELPFTRRQFLTVVSVASLIGSAAGGVLLLAAGNSAFAKLVPWLLLIAAAFLTMAPSIREFAAKRQGHESFTALFIGQLIIAVYGGYFGAGMGVLMIAVYLVATSIDLKSANAIRMMCGCIINTIAVVIFAWRGALVYGAGVPMLLAAVLGGYMGARTVKRLNASHARIAILVYAWGLTAWFFFRRYALR